MKNIIKSGIFMLMAFLTWAACSPQDNDDHSLGKMPQESELNFTATPTAEKANVIEFKNESGISGVATWDLGNGTTAKGETATAQYPFAGDYTVAMTLYTTGGSVTITKDISIAQDDMSLLDTPMYNALTGGAANLEGKTWVFDEYHNGHFAVGPKDEEDITKLWWTCPAQGKLGSSLYTQELTFIQVGVKLIWRNNGYIYTNAPGKDALGGNFIENPGGAGDFDVEYVPKDSYTFALDETANTLTLNGGAFVGHYTGSSTYQILNLTDDEMFLKVVSAVEPGNGWWYRFIPKEKNIKPEIPLKAIPLFDDFEMAKATVDFDREDMGNLKYIYANPAPVPVNTSKTVYLYEKTASPSSNISFTASGYKFDLTKVNKVRMKVFIPSYNDYTTENGKEDWGPYAQLQKQLEVKLQNASLGGNAWQTQTTIVKDNLETNKWLELEFDFSGVSERTDYDKIVVQFGAEGHYGTGFFFFDDFSFDE